MQQDMQRSFPADEINDKRTRAFNVIAFGLQHNLNGKCDTDLINEIFADITDLINEIFADITDFPRAILTARINKPCDNEPLPLRVTFNSHSDALFVLRNKEKLSKHKLSVRNDKTPNQQNYIKSLQSELSTRTNNGEKDLRIKYKKEVPCIVKVTKKRNKNKKKLINSGSTSNIQNNLLFYYQNADGMRTKLSDLRDSVYFNTCDYDVLILTETWLNINYTDHEFKLRNFTIFRLDRNANTSKAKRGGGVLFAVCDGISCTPIHNTSSNIEHLFIKLNDHNII